jgi:hypothetical protein
MLYIIDSKNKLKFEALMNALGKSLEQKINIQRIKTKGMPDVTPTTISNTTQAAIDGVNALVRSFLTEDDRSNNPAIAICLQKGVDLDQSVLTCVIAIRKTDSCEVFTTSCTAIPLSLKVKQLVQQKKLLYEAYRVVYGDAVADKQVSLYEKVCPGCLEVDWLTEGISLALRQYT